MSAPHSLRVFVLSLCKYWCRQKSIGEKQKYQFEIRYSVLYGCINYVTEDFISIEVTLCFQNTGNLLRAFKVAVSDFDWPVGLVVRDPDC